MSRPSSPTNKDPPLSRPSLASLRQSFASAFEGTRTPATTSAAAIAPARSSDFYDGMNAATSGSIGANDGEFSFTGLGFSDDVMLFPGGVSNYSPPNSSPSLTEGSLVGIDPSLYSLDSEYGSIDAGSSILAALGRTPLRTNVSSSAGMTAPFATSATSIMKSRVSIVEGSVAEDAGDDYSLLSGITAGTSATTRGVRGVAKSITASLMGVLETPAQEGVFDGRIGLSPKKTPFTTPLEERASTPPALDLNEDPLKGLSITTPKRDPGLDAGASIAEANDPAACQVWLYDKEMMSGLCLGTIGKSGTVCVCPAVECSVKKHKSHKTELVDKTWYLLKKDNTVLISPSIAYEVTNGSALWASYEGQLFTASNWSSIINWVKSNAVAKSPSQLMSQADGSRLLQLGSIPTATVPKTPKLLSVIKSIRKPAKEGEPTPKVDFAEGVKVGFKATEESMADIYSELARLSTRIGLPSDPAASHGSCHGDIEAVHLFVSSLESSVASSQKTLTAHHDALQKCEHNFKSYGESLDQVVASALAASRAAQSAQNTVHGFQATGMVNKVSVHGQSIDSLQKEISILKSELAGVYDVVQGIIDKVPTLTNSKDSGEDTAALKSEIDALRSYTSAQLKIMKQSLDGQGPVSLGSYKFDSPEACAAQLRAWGITTPVYEYLFDPFHLLAALLYRSKTHKEVCDQAVLTMKTTLTASQITAISSFETMVPEIFSGIGAAAAPGVESSQLTRVFAAIKTFDLFDAGDGETGVLNYIRLNLRDFLPQQHQEVEALFGTICPGFLIFAGLLRDRASSALDGLFKECVELYRNLLVRACGHCSSYTQTQKAEAWQQVLILLQVYCHEVSKVRAGARNLGNYKDPTMANSLAMWACLSALRVHDDFQRNLYREHPRIAPKLTGYILSTVLRKGELASVEEKSQRAASEAQRAYNTASRAEQRVTDMRSEHDRFVTAFNQWKRSLKVDGADAFPKKDKKKRRVANNGGQVEEAKAEEEDN
eukprot:scaffold90111_cov54-Cyclotella_meneghiniana.AAC.4